jgi:hypothetical protein
MQRIKQSELWEKMEQKDTNGVPVPFSLVFVKKSTGAIVHVPKCTCTSIHSKGSTVNIKLDGETHPKTIRKCLIIAFNGASVYL